MALVIIMSVFNGFDTVIQTLINSFDPDIKITLKEGKSFTIEPHLKEKIIQLNGIEQYIECVEETALFQFNDKQFIAKIKGVSNNFLENNPLGDHVYSGDFSLSIYNQPGAIVGYDIAAFLDLSIGYPAPLKIWVPKRTEQITFDADKAFNTEAIFATSIFAMQQEYDSKYVIVPLDFARNLLEYTTEVNSVELRTISGIKTEKLKSEIQQIIGPDYHIKNRFEQQEMLYKIMRSEKWAIFLMLTFILIIASFNIIGSLSMLVIDKKRDIEILRNLGATNRTIRNIFLAEGWMLSVSGATIGVVLGLLICWLQIEFKMLRFPDTGAFIMDAYPVAIVPADIMLIFITVITIGFAAAWYPVRYIARNLK